MVAESGFSLKRIRTITETNLDVLTTRFDKQIQQTQQYSSKSPSKKNQAESSSKRDNIRNCSSTSVVNNKTCGEETRIFITVIAGTAGVSLIGAFNGRV